MGLALAGWLALVGLVLQQVAAPAPRQVKIGTSREGRPLDGFWLGRGRDWVVIVGGIHGRTEINSSALVWELLQHFDAEPDTIPPDLRLLFIPEANPDGIADGTRELADGVDPNRNFPTADWRPSTYGPGKWLADGGGESPLSEPETVALAGLIQGIHPAAVFSYHSAAGIVMGGASSLQSGLLAEYAQTSGYPPRPFVAYPVTGDLAQWCDEIGIPTVEVELTDHFDPEVERNVAAIEAGLWQISSSTTKVAQRDQPY